MKFDHEVEWEFEVTIRGTVYGKSKADAMVELQANMHQVGGDLDVIELEPVLTDEDQETIDQYMEGSEE